MIEPDYRFKIVIIGAAGSGKTAMVERLITKGFSEKPKTTIGVEYSPFNLSINDFNIVLELWDTAGQENYKSVAKTYFRSALGCVLVYDITSQKSFEELTFWNSQFRELSDPKSFVLLVGNKSDLENDRQVSFEQAENYAKNNFIQYIETSAVNNQNIKETFERMGHEIFNRVRSGEISISKNTKKSSNVVSNDLTNINVGNYCVC